ncbi:hypothetical protein PI125_g25157 [Phytophthora idaei]|nr:hypothetical protein PI125_g25157 [Phytophthora idaei]KAG3124766.1 hypothetical protein PI126_g23091 [Phytophthora idaei]
MHYNVGDRSCYYCGGTHTDISGGPHFKKACVKRQRDRQLNVKRRDIWSRPREEKKARVDHDPTPKMKGEGKGKFKAKGGRERKVVPTEDCLLMCVPVDACNAEQSQAVATPASAAPCASPPAGCNFVDTWGGPSDIRRAIVGRTDGLCIQGRCQRWARRRCSRARRASDA